MARAIQRRYPPPRWPACAGTGGRPLPEWVAGIDRNRRPRWAGIRNRETGRKDSEQFAVGGRQNAGEAKRRLGDWGIRQMGDWQERVTAGELGSLGAGGQMAIGQLGNWESEEPQGSRGGEAQRPCGEEVTEQSTERAAGSERKTEGLTSQFGKRSDLS
jgi:hypothetical protein